MMEHWKNGVLECWNDGILERGEDTRLSTLRSRATVEDVRQGFRLRSYTDFGGQDGVAKRDRMKSTGIVEGWKDGKGEKGGDQWERWKNGKGEPFGIFF